MSDSSAGAALPAAASAGAATHLAELEAQYDAHVAALREHAALAQAAIQSDADELTERAEPTHHDETNRKNP